MAISYVKRIARGRTATGDYKGVVRYTVVFQVRTTSAQDGPLVVANAVDPNTGEAIPPLGSIYSFGNDSDPYALLLSITPTQHEDDRFTWEVVCEFSNDIQDEQNPLTVPAEINVSSLRHEIPFIVDTDGNAVLNKAGHPFDPPLMKDATRYNITITKNQAAYNFDLVDTYADALNSDVFLGRAIETLKFSEFQSARKWWRQQEYWTNTYGFEYRRDGWKRKELNAGLYQKSTGNPKPCVDNNGDAVVSPVPLDNDGNQLANPTVSNVVILEFSPYISLPYAGLGIP